jgi:hypothetical protein
MLESQLQFHCHIGFVYSQALRALMLNWLTTCNLSFSDSLVVLYIALVRSKLEHFSSYGISFNRLTPIKQKICKKIQFVLLPVLKFILRNYDLIQVFYTLEQFIADADISLLYF